MIVFDGQPGRVLRMDSPGVQATTKLIELVDAPISFSVQRSIVTRLTVSQQTNVQFLHTLGSLIYIYSFGDRMGTIGLSGLAFPVGCENDDGEPGIEKMLKWYRANKASSREKPVRIMIGNTPLDGFVTESNFDVVDPTTNLVQWSISIRSLPEE